MQHVQYINMASIVVPPRLPNAESCVHSWLDLKKIIHAGDVVFSLRCSHAMIVSQFATKMTRKGQFNYCYNINLATVNYIIFRLQTFFYPFAEVCCTLGDAGNATENEFKEKLRAQKEILDKLCPTRFDMWKQWFDFLSDSPSSMSSKRIDQILQWAFREAPDNTQMFPCFFETWYQEIKELGFVPTKSEEYTQSLKNLFCTKVDNIVWDFILNNTQILGIYIGSDEAGGKHLETNNSNAVWPNDFAGVVQLTGKSRRTSNIWNRKTDGDEASGVSSGDPLGFSLKRYTVHSKENGETKENSCQFKLSSNPNTDTTVTPQQAKDMFPYIPSFSLLIPDSNVRNCYTLTDEPKTYWKFAHANQMSRNINACFSATALARDALSCGASHPIEIIMRRSLNDYRKLSLQKAMNKVKYLTPSKASAAPAALPNKGGINAVGQPMGPKKGTVANALLFQKPNGKNGDEQGGNGPTRNQGGEPGGAGKEDEGGHLMGSDSDSAGEGDEAAGGAANTFLPKTVTAKPYTIKKSRVK